MGDCLTPLLKTAQNGDFARISDARISAPLFNPLLRSHPLILPAPTVPKQLERPSIVFGSRKRLRLLAASVPVALRASRRLFPLSVR